MGSRSQRKLGLALTVVIPAKAGIQMRNVVFSSVTQREWIPAFAGMTNKRK
jgi:hypothetical protein